MFENPEINNPICVTAAFVTSVTITTVTVIPFTINDTTAGIKDTFSTNIRLNHENIS